MDTYFKYLVEQVYGEYLLRKHQGDRSDSYSTLSVVGRMFNLSSRTVSRYLRLYKLSNGLLDKVSNSTLAIRTGVELSYLSDELQDLVLDYLDNGNTITYAQSIILHKLYNLGMLNMDNFYYVCNNDWESRTTLREKEIQTFACNQVEKLRW